MVETPGNHHRYEEGSTTPMGVMVPKGLGQQEGGTVLLEPGFGDRVGHAKANPGGRRDYSGTGPRSSLRV